MSGRSEKVGYSFSSWGQGRLSEKMEKRTGRRHSQCKGPGVEVCRCQRSPEEASGPEQSEQGHNRGAGAP